MFRSVWVFFAFLVLILEDMPEVPELFTNTTLLLVDYICQLFLYILFLSIIYVSKSLECIEEEKK